MRRLTAKNTGLVKWEGEKEGIAYLGMKLYAPDRTTNPLDGLNRFPIIRSRSVVVDGYLVPCSDLELVVWES